METRKGPPRSDSRSPIMERVGVREMQSVAIVGELEFAGQSAAGRERRGFDQIRGRPKLRRKTHRSSQGSSHDVRGLTWPSSKIKKANVQNVRYQ